LRITVASLICPNCNHPLTGFDDDLFWTCLNCSRQWQWGKKGMEKGLFLIPEDYHPEKGDFYLPYYLFRFQDNDFFLPAWRMKEVSSHLNFSYSYSLKTAEHLNFHKAPWGWGVIVPVESLWPLLSAYITIGFDKELSLEKIKKMKYRICGMPCRQLGKELVDPIWNFRMSERCVARLEEYKALSIKDAEKKS